MREGKVRFDVRPDYAVVASLILAAGCAAPATPAADPLGEARAAYEACLAQPPVERTFYFAAGHVLSDGDVPAPGSEPGNAFSSGFLTNDLKEWLSRPLEKGMAINGTVTLEYWVRAAGTPAPLVLGGDPGEGYHFFNQFGSDRSLQPAYATEYSAVAPTPGTVDHYTEVLTMPPGGFFVEKGDRLRVLLTDLAIDGPDGSGHDVLFGGQTPSSISFTSTCFPERTWSKRPGGVERDVSLPANQGLLTGAVPAGEANQVDVGAVLNHDVDGAMRRVTITLAQTGDPNPVKDDIDLEILDATGTVVWSIGSPYSDESGTLWQPNLAAVALTDQLTVRVNSYSGVAYTGHLSVVVDAGVLAGFPPYA